MYSTEIIVKNALANLLDLDDISEIKMNQPLEEFALDSLASVMFLIKLEDNIDGFLVDPETLKLKDIETVESMLHYIQSQLYNKRILH